MSIPSKCKAAVAEKAGEKLVLKDIDVRKPEKGQLLIKVLACGVCHSDEFVRQGAFGDLFPRILGHEAIGDVVAVGEGEKRWKVGDRVGAGWHGGHDATCKACNRGMFQMCDNAQINGVSRDGGYAEYCIIESLATVSVPKDADPVKACPLLCAGVTLFNGIRKMNIPQGDIVAVQGLGGLGHLGLQYSRKMGYMTVALSSSDKKKDLSMKLGANVYIDGSKEDQGAALAKMGGASLIVVTAPNPKVIEGLLNGLAAGGKLLILAPVGDVPVNTITMITKGLSVHGWPSGHALDSEEAIAFAQNQGVECMVEKFSLDDVNKAMEHLTSGDVRFRCVIVP